MVLVLGILHEYSQRFLLSHMLPPALGPHQASPQVGEPGRHRSCGGALLLTIGATSRAARVRVSGSDEMISEEVSMTSHSVSMTI